MAYAQIRQESMERYFEDETMADRQLREESIEADTGPEGWMRLGKDMVRRVSAEECRLEMGWAAEMGSHKGKERAKEGRVGSMTDNERTIRGEMGRRTRDQTPGNSQ